MRDDYLAVLHSSFATVFDRRAEIAERFYHNLFTAAPDARALFSDDMGPQKVMFATMLAEIVHYAETPEDFARRVRAMAERHRRYNIPPSVFERAARALQDALADVLGDLLSESELRVWDLAAGKMTEAMASATRS